MKSSRNTIFQQIESVLLERKKMFDQQERPKRPSYVYSLLQGGLEQINAKIQEESQEFQDAMLEADREHIFRECADLFFHSLIGLVYSGVSFRDVEQELERRFGLSGIDEKNNRSV